MDNSKFIIVDNTLLHDSRIVLAKNFSLIPQLMTKFHDGVEGGHDGFLQIYQRLNH